jgi:hypothetical protein
VEINYSDEESSEEEEEEKKKAQEVALFAIGHLSSPLTLISTHRANFRRM